MFFKQNGNKKSSKNKSSGMFHFFTNSHNLDNYSDLIIGYNNGDLIKIPETGQFQNFLITGSIGSGKTSSSVYPFTKQFFQMIKHEKIGFLILDVKGNFVNYVNKIKDELFLNNIYEISLHSNVFYNPLNKPNLKPQVLANRLRVILELLSSNNSEDSYWLDKTETTISHAISLIRIYNKNYVTFAELHKIIFDKQYYSEKVSDLKQLFLKNKLNTNQIFDLNCALTFFEKEFFQLDERTSNIIKSEISRITNTFVNDIDILRTFCPPKEKINFKGFHDLVINGGVVILNINIAKYQMLSKIIATYLKLDFQTEVLDSINSSNIKKVFICDEYDKYATSSDGDFFSMSREAKCVNIIATQSYSSINQSIKNETVLKIILQNLVNKIWFRQDDIFTIEESQKLLGQEFKHLKQRSISENSHESNFSLITQSFTQTKSNISESISDHIQKDYIYDTSFFSRDLKTFTALCFLSDGNTMLDPKKISMIPYFKNN